MRSLGRKALPQSRVVSVMNLTSLTDQLFRYHPTQMHVSAILYLYHDTRVCCQPRCPIALARAGLQDLHGSRHGVRPERVVLWLLLAVGRRGCGYGFDVSGVQASAEGPHCSHAIG